MLNVVRNEIIMCHDRDLRWMNRLIKDFILCKDNFYKTFVQRKYTDQCTLMPNKSILLSQLTLLTEN